MPSAEANITIEKLMSGTQPKASTECPPDFNTINTPSAIKPIAVPLFEIANKSCEKIPFIRNVAIEMIQ